MYFAPYLDETGLHLPTYGDRLEALLGAYRSIFGADVNLDISSPDYQLLSVFARALDDLSALILSSFVSRNPAYASGVALDLHLPLAGLSRAGATCSTVYLTLSGEPSATLSEAPLALDDAGFLWRCDGSTIHLDAAGAARVSATCETPGAVSAPAGTIHKLVSPVAGLFSLVNDSAASPGVDAETDVSCRARLALAATAPSRYLLDSLRDALRALPYVRGCAVYLNESDTADSAKGIAAHSVMAVMAGGGNALIAKAIFENKAPGIGTSGSTAYDITDAYGFSHTVRCLRATETPLQIAVELKALAGFDASVVDKIRDALAAWGKTLDVAQDVVVPSLAFLIYGAVPSSALSTFSLTLLSVAAGGEATSQVLSCPWNVRYTLQANMIQILVV
jgi:uncharacterized phage protein gp47/JayE